MADEPKKIEFSQFSTSHTGGQLMDIETGGNTETRYFYVSAPSWWAQVTINKNWGSWGRSFTLTASYWNGSKWVQAWSETHSWGQFESGEWNYYFNHNLSDKDSHSGDVADAILWELALSIPELYRKRFYLYTGSVGCLGQTKYDSMCKGKLIYSAGRLGEDSRHAPGTTQKRDEALALFSQSADRGTPIAYTHEAKLVFANYF